jgi:HlyD family secretion protein
MKHRTWILATFAATALAAPALYLTFQPLPVEWRTAPLERGEMVGVVQASGTLEPLVLVQVGTQVSGRISAIHADFNSLVRKGDLLAELDPTLPKVAVDEARATLDAAKATLEEARRQEHRAVEMHHQSIIPDQDLETAEVALSTAEDGVKSAQAQLEAAQANLGYCSIRSPVDGVVLDRAVEVGQTVAASYATPNLFSIAQDLSRMKVEVQVDESDTGELSVGQEGSFTVDSLPGRTFPATVGEIRLNPTNDNNVVTYTLVIQVRNIPLGKAKGASGEASPLPPPRIPSLVTAQGPSFPGDLAFRAGMTANVTLVTGRYPSLWKVPNAGLRFVPPASTVAGGPKAQAQAGPPPGTAMKAPAGRFWVLEQGRPREVRVKTGITDGYYTEIEGEGLRPGLPVIVGMAKKPNPGS